MISRTVELERGQLVEYTGNYSYYLAEKERRFAAAQAAYERQQRELKRQQGFIDRFRAKAPRRPRSRAARRRWRGSSGSRRRASSRAGWRCASRRRSRPTAKSSPSRISSSGTVRRRFRRVGADAGARRAAGAGRAERVGKSTLLRMLATSRAGRGTLLLGPA